MAEKNLGFKFERKRIKKDIKMSPSCPDYKPTENMGNCELSKICKNATYQFSKNDAYSDCYGGTKESEVEYRRKYLIKDNRWQ